MEGTNNNHGRVEVPFPVKLPLVVAAVVWIVVSVVGHCILPVAPQAPFAGLSAFRLASSGIQVLMAVYMCAVVVPGFWPIKMPAHWVAPIQVFAWCVPSLVSAFLASLALSSGSLLLSIGLALMALCVMVVVPVLGNLVAMLFYVALMQVLRPIWWVLGRPESGFFGHKSPGGALSAKGTEASTALPASSNQDAGANVTNQAPQYEFDWKLPKRAFADLAGMEQLKSELAEAIAPFVAYGKSKEVADRNGILLFGPPGNGKTAFAEAVAGELRFPFVRVSGVDLTSKWVNESPAMLKSLFLQAAAHQPCVVFIDEMDSVGKDRSGNNLSEEDRKLVTALLKLIDEARAQQVVLVAATNYPDGLDKALTRDGRFDFRIEVPNPDYEARKGMLTGMVAKHNIPVSKETIEYVARLWDRRSAAFIESTVKRIRDSRKLGGSGPATVEDFKVASKAASRRAGNIPSSGQKLSELALPARVRREAESLLYRLRNWEKITEQGGEPPSGVLLLGPPGTGKTKLANALVRELGDWHIFEVNATAVLNDPRKFKEIVQLASDHRPAVVFLDEAEELLRDRQFSSAAGATNEILKCMDGLMGKVPEVLFLAATNMADVIDQAALRGGRFSEKIFMGPLDGQDLVDFLDIEFSNRTAVNFDHGLTSSSLAMHLGEATPSWAISVLKKAVNYTFDAKEAGRAVTMEDIDRAIGAMTV